MGDDVRQYQPIHRLAALPTAAWLGIHVLLYLSLSAAVLVLWDMPSSSLVETLLFTVFGVLSLAPVLAFLSVAGTFCLGVLRLLTDARWYWFRLAAVLLFAVPFPLIVFLASDGATALPIFGAQLATALLIVQPRKKPGRWADQDPAMGDYR